MAVLIGIDEAGFGPLLGPLVVSSCAFEMPHSLLETNLWQLLKKSVSNGKKKLSGRLLITDSKKAYTRSTGTKHLQRTVLACLKCLDQNPSTLNELLALLAGDCQVRLNSYPWYKGAGDYQISANADDLEIASAVLADDLASNDIKLLQLKSRCLDVAYYNNMVASVKNKSTVLFTATCQLIQDAWDNLSGNDLQIIIDRQGGRVNYRPVLQRMFGDLELTIIHQSPALSSYQLESGQKKMRLHFTIKADQRFLPVSLASMISKYLRELLVENINRYFSSFHSQLKPTAGYWKDGLRFIDDLKQNIPHVQYDANQLIRSR